MRFFINIPYTFLIWAMPVVVLANGGDHAPGEEHDAASDVAAINPLFLGGAALAVGAGVFLVWYFVLRKKPPATPAA